MIDWYKLKRGEAMSKLAEWVEDNWLLLASFLAVYVLLLVTIISFSWVFGYWYNGLTANKFEINSCWQGIAAVASGFISPILMTLAGLAKYNINSKFNSISGSPPRGGKL